MSEHRRKHDAPASDRAHKKWLSGLANGLNHIDNYVDEVQEGKPTLTRFTVRCDPDDEEGVLVVCKGYIGTEWHVAFHRGDTVSEAISGLGNRLRNGSLRWRVDEYEK